MDHVKKTRKELVWDRALGAMLRSARKKKSMTVPQLAGLTSKTSRTITSYETGERRPDARTLLQLAMLLSIDLNALAKTSLAWGKTAKARDKRQLTLPETDAE